MSGSKLIQVFQMATLAARGLADPVQAQSALSKIKQQATFLAQQLSNDKRRYVNAPVDKAADLFLIPDNLGTIAHGGVPATPVPFKMPAPGGIILWMSIQVLEGTQIGIASLQVDIRRNDGKTYFGSNGTGVAFIPCTCLSPLNAPAMPMGVRYTSGESLSFSFKNLHAANDYTPLVVMGIAEEDPSGAQ